MKQILLFLALCLTARAQQPVTVQNNGSGTGTFNTPGISYYLAGPAASTWDFSLVNVKGISGGGGGGGVTQLIAGTNITLSPSIGTGTVTVNATSGGSPGGVSGLLQYNNSGAFGGTSTTAGGGLSWLTAPFTLSFVESSNNNVFPGGYSNINTNTGTSATSNYANTTGTSVANWTTTGQNYSGAFLSGGPNGPSTNLYTVNAIPLVLGTNSAANETIAPGGATNFSNNVTVNGALSAGSFILPTATPYGVLGTNGAGAVAAYSNFVNVKWFGAKIDGSTADDAAVASAVAYLAGLGGGGLYIPAGTMVLTSTGIQLVNVSNVHVFGDGNGTIIKFLPTLPGTNYKAVDIGGTLYETGTITGQHAGAINIGDTGFTVSSSTNISAGTWLQVDQVDTGSGLASPVVQDIVQVQSINAGTGVVVLMYPMRVAFPNTRTTVFNNFRTPTSQNDSISDLQIITTLQAPSTPLTGLYIEKAFNVSVDRITSTPANGNAMVGYACKGLSVSQSNFLNTSGQDNEFAYDADLRLTGDQFSNDSAFQPTATLSLDFGTCFFSVTGCTIGPGTSINLELLYGVHDGDVTGNSFGYLVSGGSELQVDGVGCFNVTLAHNSFAAGDSGVNGVIFSTTSGWTTAIVSAGNVIGPNTFGGVYASHYPFPLSTDHYIDVYTGNYSFLTDSVIVAENMTFLPNTSAVNANYQILWMGNTTAGVAAEVYDTTGFTFNPSTGGEAIPGNLKLGTSGSVVGSIVLNNATSGTDTISPPTGALGTVTLTLPSTSGTIALSSNAADVSTVGAGTAYTMTNSVANVVFGTTSPTVTLTAAGTYLIQYTAQTSLAGATYAGVQSVNYLMNRQNNTPATIAGTSFSGVLPIVTTTTDLSSSVSCAGVLYTTANTNDIIGLQADVSATPSAGSVTCSGATITAVWLHP